MLIIVLLLCRKAAVNDPNNMNQTAYNAQMYSTLLVREVEFCHTTTCFQKKERNSQRRSQSPLFFGNQGACEDTDPATPHAHIAER